jgi:4-amino-4-deoxy-L-arabinose transferase-like glycosyltransferase
VPHIGPGSQASHWRPPATHRQEQRFVNAVTLKPIDLRAPRWSQALERVAVRYFWQCFVTVLAFMTWNVLWRLGDTWVRDCDEGRYAVAASEMLHAHSPLITTYAGATEFWNLKPPLGYWLLDLSYWAVGETPFALRLPAAICALVATALTMLMTRRIAGPRAAILAGIVLATSFGFLGHHGARSGELDAPLTLLLLLFLMLAPHLMASRPARLAAGLVLALGFLLKSFAILPFVAAVAIYCLITRGIASWRVWPLPAAVIVVTAATWAVARSVAEDSWEFVRRMFVEDLLLRSTTSIDSITSIDAGGVNSAWDYVGALFDRLAPWPVFVLLAFGLSRHFARHRLSSDTATLMWCYTLVPLLFFTLARTHHSWYVIPTYPAWAILGAVGTLEVLKRAEGFEFAAPGFAALVVICVLACEARLVAHMEIYERMPPSQVFLASLRNRLAGSRPYLHTTFMPSYSERFFLQVVDGFELDDLSAADLSLSRTFPSGGPVLIRKSELGLAEIPLHATGIAVLEQNEDYALIRLPTPATAVATD